MPMTKIHLRGELGMKFGFQLKACVHSVREAIDILEANFPEIRHYFARSHERGYAYQVYVGDWNIDKDQLTLPTGQQTISIAPVIMGAGGAFGKIILGVGLIALGATGIGLPFASASTLILIGATMALSGVLSLFNQPKAPDPNEDKSKPSLIFNGGVNTTAQGGRLPVVYGGGGYKSGVYDDGFLVGSQVLSASIRSSFTSDTSPDEE